MGVHNRKFGHGGNIRELATLSERSESEILDFSANINPQGLPDWLRSTVSSGLSGLVNYPDPNCTDLVNAACEKWGIFSEEILFCNGTTEILYMLPGMFNRKRAIIPVPAYVDYAVACDVAGLPVEKVFLREEDDFRLDPQSLQDRLRGDELVFIGQPNNPTGLMNDPDMILNVADKNPASLFVIDEAFADFTEVRDRFVNKRLRNVLTLCSLTKVFAIPGLRLGFISGHKENILEIRNQMPPWSVNSIAQMVGEAALSDNDYLTNTKIFINRERQRFSRRLDSIPGIHVYPGEANYLFARVDHEDLKAPELALKLLDKGIAIRVCDNYDGLDDRFFRVAVRTSRENDLLIEAIRSILGISSGLASPKKAASIMVQGISSNAGKSIINAALCRILVQDGYRVAPFKAQNMSLNSFVTMDEGEMGRAQVVQAQACSLSPDVRMNPILLKPNTDVGSQVIVMGKPIGNMDVNEYIKYKPEVFKKAKQAYDSLASEFDVIVLEGAGSPAEVNLKHHDIVNMSMAKHAEAPVLLVGDIDRGGVFASFIGTMEVLSEWERNCVSGFIINKFRGNKDLLDDAIEFTFRYTGLPTFGVVPFIKNLGLPEEDSVSFKMEIRGNNRAKDEDTVDIVVIDLPHISNFTDFDSLRMEPDVNLRIVRDVKKLGKPDALILPGSKNVIKDMEYLLEDGFSEGIEDLIAGRRTEVIGICGGFQLLGDTIGDPFGVESKGEIVKGLLALPITTTLDREKTLKDIIAQHPETGFELKGYEIHHGKTDNGPLKPMIIRDDGEIIGLRTEDHMVWGTYLHGVFDNDGFRRWFIDRLRKRRGLTEAGGILVHYDLEPAFDRLADIVRVSLDIKAIYGMIGIG